MSKWPVIKIEDCFQFIRNGLSVKQNNEELGLPISRIETISDSVINSKRVGYAGLNESDCSQWLLKSGDMLFSHINSLTHIGKCAVYRNHPQKIIHGMNLLCFRCDDEVADPEFIKYLFQSTGFKKQLNKSVKKSVNQASVSIADIKKISIPLPPLDEQKRIAEILDTADLIRQKRKAAIAKLDQLGQAVFLEMFGDPVKNEKGWPYCQLGENINIKHSFAFQSEFFADSGTFTLLTPGNFHEEGGFRNRGEKQKYYFGEIPQDYILTKGDLLVAMTEQAPGLLGSTLFVPDTGNYLHNQRLGLVKMDARYINKRFIFSLFNQKTVRKMIHAKATGTKVRHTSPTKIEILKTIMPPVEIQEKFSIILTEIESIRNIQQSILLKDEALFFSLQQRAFVGEL